MNIHVLGTAAFEGIPSLFCGCETCKQAFQSGGRNIRTRTSIMIDGELKIDFPPDTYLHMLRDGLDLDKVKDLLFTHSHSDHLYAEDLVARLNGYAQSGDEPIHVYGHDNVLAKCMQVLALEGGPKNKFEFHRVQPFERYQMQTASILPLPAGHAALETCLVYVIEKDGKTIFHGHDSGWFPDSTWEKLKEQKLDFVILECTSGRSPNRYGHMNVDAVLETKQWMEENGVLNPGAQVIVTHFSHNAHLLHEDLVAIFEPHGIQVAYDGMIVEL